MVAALAAIALAASACGSGTAAPTAARSASPGGAWGPPPLVNPTEVRLSAENAHVELDPAKDYVIVPPERPLQLSGGVAITGGRNIVWRGGTIRIPSTVDPARKNAGRGLYLLNQTGTVHIEGLRIDGLGLTEGIDLSQPLGATIQLVDVQIDHVRTRPGLETHPDVLQSWAGPRILRIDGLTATTDYQGIFLQPQAYGPVDVQLVDLRDVRIKGTTRSAYLLWQATRVPLRLRDVRISRHGQRPRRQMMWPSPRAWRGVRYVR